MRVRMWAALRTMERQRLEEAAIAAEPMARFAWLYFNAHRGEKQQPLPLEQFRVYAMPNEDAQVEAGISAEAAAAVVSLANDGKVPPYVLGAWGEVQKVANARPIEAPSPRLLRSDDGMVSVVAPRFVDRGVRGGLVGVGGIVSGEVVVRDIDRPLLTWKVVVPRRAAAGWVEANLLLLTAT